MSITAAQYMQLILGEVVDTSANDLANNISTIWNMYAYADSVQNAPNLHYLLAKRHAISFLIGKNRQLFDISIGEQRASYSGLIRNLQAMLSIVDEELNEVKRIAKGLRVPAGGVITATNPITVDSDPRTVGSDDPNDRALRGDPLLPTIRTKLL